MNRSTSSSTKKPGTLRRRTVLYVDPDPSYAADLNDAWRQLQLEDHLHIVPSHAAALEFLNFAYSKDGNASLIAVVLDPEATGEETGPFLREIRKQWGKDAVPVVFWTRDNKTYAVLEGRGVESVITKPRVLRLIQALDEACPLRVRPFRPFMGNMSFLQLIPQPTVGMSG